MRALISRLSYYSQSRTPAHSHVPRTIQTEQSKSPTAATSEARTSKLLKSAWKRSVFCVGLRTVYNCNSITRIGRFSSAQAVAATLTILVGIHGFPLASTSAVLKELLSRRRREQHQYRGKPDLIEDVPSPPTSAPEPADDVASQAQEGRCDSEGPGLAMEPLRLESVCVESPRRSQGSGVTGASRADSDPIGGSASSSHSLDPTKPPKRTSDETGSPLDAAISRRDFAYESSSSLDTLPSRGSPPQVWPPLDPSSSVQSFVTCPTSSPRPSYRSLHRDAYGPMTRSESPKPISLTGRRRLSFSAPGPSGLRVSIAADPHNELRDDTSTKGSEKPRRGQGIPEEALGPVSTVTSPPTRRILIIGSDYQTGTRRTATMFSVDTLLGFDNDIALLWEAFTGRGYEAELYDKKDYRRKDILDRVAAFLRGAESGDIRAVAFTGHAYSAPDGTIMLVPPYCPTIETAIPCTVWEDNMRKHSQPGSIVFSIMAHCFSGDFMHQEHDYQTRATQEGNFESSPHNADEATFITFASSTKKQRSFESTVERRLEAGAYDHFLYALAMTIKDKEVCTWGSFFTTFKKNFDRARLNASWAHHYTPGADVTTYEEGCVESECQRAYNWRKENLQEPRFSASGILSYSRMFMLPTST